MDLGKSTRKLLDEPLVGVRDHAIVKRSFSQTGDFIRGDVWRPKNLP